MNYELIKYTIFKTRWGYFGFAGTEYGLYRTCLPLAEREKVKSRLLKDLSFGHRASTDRRAARRDAPQRAQSIGNRAPRIELDKALFKTTQERITAYFEGAYVNFNRDIPIILDGLSQFAISVLTACRDIRFGQTISYGRLAKRIDQPAVASPVRNSVNPVKSLTSNRVKGDKPQKGKISNGARAVGGALAKNPLPLIIPCHRVVRSDGKIGGFSAAEGVTLKKKMLELEQQVLIESQY